MDAESDYYYLQTRYYSPVLRRFLSHDRYDLLSTCAEDGHLNLYAYCNNNPVMYIQNPVTSGGAIIDVALSKSGGEDSLPIVSAPSGWTFMSNLVLANGSFKNGLLFGEGKVTAFYANKKMGMEIDFNNANIYLCASSTFSYINATGQIGIGNENLSVSLVGVGDYLTAVGMAGIFIGKEEKNCFVGIGVEAAVLKATSGVQLSVLGTQIELGAEVSVMSAGFNFGIGIKNGKIYYKSGFALLIGGSFYFSIQIR